MNSMLATDGAAPPVAQPATRSLLETWGKNEAMRHVPAIEWITAKLDQYVRSRVEKIVAVYTSLPSDDPRHATMETELRSLCRSIDRLGDAARHTRHQNAPNDLPSRLTWAINHAVSSLGALDPTLFGRRYPVQTHERSKGEPVYAALLVVMQCVERVLQTVRAIDPGIDERLLEGLVVLVEPLRADAIA
jgi:hypothetical protein